MRRRSKRFLSRIAGVLAFATMCIFSLQVQATPISALSFSVTSTNATAFDTTRGYAFNVTQSGLLVTALSFWDEGGDGLNESHDIGLWDPSGSLIASVTIGAGTSDSLLDGFRYVDIVDVALSVGNGYVVGATFLDGSFDKQANLWTGLTTAPGIEYVEGRYINDTGPGVLTLPTFSFTGLPGGSFLVDNVSAPEPATIALMGFGLAGLGFSRRKKST